MKDVNSYIDYLVKWLQVSTNKANLNGLIVGVSGGIDSAVVAALIKKAFPNDSLGLILPIYSKESDVKDAKEVCNSLDLDYQIIELDQTFDSIKTAISKDIKEHDAFKLALANTKARLRMTTLYAYAQNYGYLVVGTDNACEWFTGYFTKYGDGGVDLVPLVHLKKSEVYELAKALNIPQAILDKTPSAGLIDGVNDEDEMGFSYKELEAYMDGKRVSQQAQERIERLHKISAHKRALASKPEKKASDF